MLVIRGLTQYCATGANLLASTKIEIGLVPIFYFCDGMEGVEHEGAAAQKADEGAGDGSLITDGTPWDMSDKKQAQADRR